MRLAVSIGCPSGIGPEVSVAAAAKSKSRVLLVGDLGALRAAAKAMGVDPERLVEVPDAAAAFQGPRRIAVLSPIRLAARDRAPGKPTAAGGAAQLAWIDRATDLVAAGEADALVTGPVSKDAIARSGVPGSKHFRGHTEHIADRLHAAEVTMAFYAPERDLTASLVTTHLPLAEVPRAITRAAVARATYWTAHHVARARGGTMKVVVASLNPHAGEGGLLGDEETRTIVPGIAAARLRIGANAIGVDVVGPVPAETAFRLAARGDFAAVVAMYHDQATIPMKLLAFGEAVNVSLGLPIVRTSVDHGTAYDRAYRGTADPGGMLGAMSLAEKLARL